MNLYRPRAARVLALAAFISGAAAVNGQECTPVVAVPFTIATPGTYCLTESLTTAETTGAAIEIGTDDVVLDFQGHSLDGTSAGVSTRAQGVHSLNRRRITVRNGRLVGFYIGVHLDLSVDSGDHLVENMLVEQSRWKAIKLEGTSNVMRGNTVRFVGGGGHHVDGVSACENNYNGSIEAYNNTLIDVGAGEADSSPDGMMLYCRNALAIGNRLVNVGDSGISLGGGFCKDNVLEYVYGRPYDRNFGAGCKLVGSTNHNYP